MVGTFKTKGNSSEWEWKNAEAVEETEVSMYITNFPPHINSKHLRKICAGVGTVVDVYLPRKLSNSGKPFAFVRFLLRLQSDDDVSELARKLSLIWIGNYHLFATLARRQKKPFYQSQTRHNEMKQIVLEEDRLSALPDCLLIEILSRLPSTKHAITTSTLSKRWKHLWTWLPTLIFNKDQITFPLSNYYSNVDKTLTQCRCLKLKKFQVSIYYDYHDTEFKFVSQFKEWLRYAISCNVEEVNITCEFGLNLNEFMLDQFFFNGSCFTDMRIVGFTMNPSRAISWNKLRSLSISDVILDEEVIENILSGSPLLETLELHAFRGYRQLNITSKSIKNLVLSRYWGDYEPSFSHIIAPNILSLSIQYYFALLNPLLLNVPSLVEANLDYDGGGDYRWNEGYVTAYEEEQVVLKGFILNLSHVRELKIGVSCSKALFRLKAEGFVFPSNLREPEGFERVEDGYL